MRFGIKTIVTITCAMFLFMGIIIGFIMAPIKKGVYCNSNNGNKYSEDEDMWDDEWDEDDWRVSKSSNENIPF